MSNSGLLPTYDVNDNYRIGKGNQHQGPRPRSPKPAESRQRTPPPPFTAVSRALQSHRTSLSTSSIASSTAEQYSDKDTLLPKMNGITFSDDELRLPSRKPGLVGTAVSHFHYVKRKKGRWFLLVVVTGLFIVAFVRYSATTVGPHGANLSGDSFHSTSADGMTDADEEQSQWAKLAVPGGGAARIYQDQQKQEQVRRPLTELGAEADSVYENVGSVDIHEYRRDLESFLDLAFPAKDSDLSDQDSLLNILYDYMPPPTSAELVARYRQRTSADRNKEAEEASPQSGFQRMMLLPLRSLSDNVRSLRNGLSKLSERNPERSAHHTIQRNIFQTSWQQGRTPPDEMGVTTWRDMNGGDDYKYQYFDDAAAHDWISTRFNMSGDPPLRAGRTPGRGGIADTHARMAGIPVMQSDFWRYAILASEGGVYSDLDTTCLRPIVTWHRDPWARWTPKLPAGAEKSVNGESVEPTPALIVGIEQDVNDRPDWHQWYPRPVGIVQWTMASSRGHPVMIDVLRRVSRSVNPVADINDDDEPEAQESASRKLEAVVEKTGPGPFTDSVLRYLGAKYNVTWPELRGLPQEGRMFGNNDVLVLSVTAFSPGVGQFGAGDTTHDAALVWHQFSGSWKKEHGARV